MKTLGRIITVAAVLGAFGAATYVFHLYRQVPGLEGYDFSRLREQAEERAEGLSEWTPLSGMSRVLRTAVVYGEDSTFFEHGGVKLEALRDALIRNVREWRFAMGGSTISQQVVKNVFLTGEKSVERKIKEFFLTRRLEERFSKEQILEVYLNIAEFGIDLNGVDQASWYYFGKSPAEVEAGEGAFLASLLSSPKSMHRRILNAGKIGRAKLRKIARILSDMARTHEITEPDLERAEAFLDRLRRDSGL